MVGAYGSADNEVVTITAVVPDVSFAAVFANAHVAGEQIVGATFPVRQPTDPLFEQGEMLAYLSSAVNDFLTDVPLCYNVVEGVEIGPSEPTGVLPDDSMMPVRIAALTPDGPYPLRETSQSNLDTYDYRWSVLSQNYDYPVAYYRDKIPMQNFGIWLSWGTRQSLRSCMRNGQCDSWTRGRLPVPGHLLPNSEVADVGLRLQQGRGEPQPCAGEVLADPLHLRL